MSKGYKKMEIKITSSAFEDGGMIPSKYTCDGADVSPQLQWEQVPDGTVSIALISDDPDITFEVPLPKNGNKVKAGDINSDGKADIIMFYDVDDDEGRSTKIIRVLMAEG